MKGYGEDNTPAPGAKPDELSTTRDDRRRHNIMKLQFDPNTSTGLSQSKSLLIAAAGALLLGVLIFLFMDSLALMVKWWEREEYSHGYMIPFVAAFLVYQRVNRLPDAYRKGSWWGTILLVLAIFLFVLGEMSAIYTLIQYGFLVALYGLVISLFGVSGFTLFLGPLLYLIFMIPLPNFIYFNLSSQLQLISSKIGVWFIRLFDIAVYLEGNVIDLGAMKLQVVEACSGLRYLFPLMSFGFLIVCIYKAPFWQRALLFLSTIPITVLMNSFRIGVIGVTVDRWGVKMAEGFLHDFEGWIIFMSCLAILLLEAFILHKLTRSSGSMLDKLDLDLPRVNLRWSDVPLSFSRQAPLLAGSAFVLMMSPWLLSLSEREEVPPDNRERLTQFPLFHSGWSGREGALERDVLDTLKLSDYLIADYRRSDALLTTPPVNLYVAWYSSQKKGASIHSPRSCIPGGGWRMDELDQIAIDGVQHISGGPLRVNRAIIRKDQHAQIVYYWFEGRGRNITNEYLAKWYIFVDSLLHSRSDGALVRVVTAIPEGTSIGEADKRLQKFLQDFYPKIPQFAP
jgi:exosortase D (VPLPA-CTERM-specific)